MKSPFTLALLLSIAFTLQATPTFAETLQEQYMSYFKDIATKINDQCKDLPPGTLTVEVRINPSGKVDGTVPFTATSADYKQAVLAAIQKAGPFSVPPFTDVIGATIGIPLDFNGPNVSVDRSAVMVPQRTTNALWSRANKLSSEGKFADALKVFMFSDQLTPSRFLRECIGKTYYKQAVSLRAKDPSGTIHALEKACTYNPSDKQASIDLDSALLEQGKDPSVAEVRYAMAQDRLKEGDKAAALAELSEALSLTPNSKWRQELAELSSQVLPSLTARQINAQSMPSATPKSPFSLSSDHMSAAMAAVLQRKYDLAADEFKQASQSVPLLSTASLVKSHTPYELAYIAGANAGRASALRLGGDTENSRKEYERLLQADKEQKTEDSLVHTLSLSEYGTLLCGTQELKAGITALSGAIELMPKYSLILSLENSDIQVTLACAQALDGKSSEAQTNLTKAQRNRRLKLGVQHPDVANAWPITNVEREFKDEILPRARKDFEAGEASLGSLPPDMTMANSIEQYARVLIVDRQFQTATDLLKRSIALKRKLDGPNTPRALYDLCELANCSIATSKPAEALSYYESALSLSANSALKLPPLPLSSRALILDGIANAAERTGDISKAEGNYKQALQLRRDWYWHDHADIASSLVSLANFYIRNDKQADAEPLLAEASAIRDKLIGKPAWTGFPPMDSYSILVKQQFQQVPEAKNE